MNFKQLVQVFENTHFHLQEKAVSAVNKSLTIRNWLFGFYIIEYEQKGEDRAKYGEGVLKNIAKKLSAKLKGMNERYLRDCRQFYGAYPQIVEIINQLELPKEIWRSVTPKLQRHANELDARLLLERLSYTHLLELSKQQDISKRMFYEIQAIKGNWSVRELERQAESLLYERTGLSTNKNGLILDVNKEAEPRTPSGIMRDPYVFDFVGLKPKEKFNESDLESALIDHLQEFLLELGKGFCFEARQKRIFIDGDYHCIDLVFYHRVLKCHVLIDLKTRKFKHGDAGQMNFYLNYYKANEICEDDNPPVGIVLCTDRSTSTVKYATGSLDNQMFVSRYQLQLPTVKELEEFIKHDLKILGGSV